MTSNEDVERPIRFAYTVSIRWPDGREFIGESSVKPTLIEVARALRSIADATERRAYELHTEQNQTSD